MLKTPLLMALLLAVNLPAFATDEVVKEVIREAECTDQRLPVIGQQERVVLATSGATLAARVDSGATTSSINAQDIELYERDGKAWVRFSVPGGEHDNTEYDLKVERTATIKRHGAAPVERPVVKLGVRLGKYDQPHSFSLADRSQFDFPVLLGRNFLINNFLIDVSKKNQLRTSKKLEKTP